MLLLVDRPLIQYAVDEARNAWIKQFIFVSAVRQAKRLVGDAKFTVLLPDDVILHPTGALAQMVEAHGNIGGHMVPTMDVPRFVVSPYGVLDVARKDGRIAQARSLVEKPQPHLIPSTQAIV